MTWGESICMQAAAMLIKLHIRQPRPGCQAVWSASIIRLISTWQKISFASTEPGGGGGRALTSCIMFRSFHFLIYKNSPFPRTCITLIFPSRFSSINPIIEWMIVFKRKNTKEQNGPIVVNKSQGDQCFGHFEVFSNNFTSSFLLFPPIVSPQLKNVWRGGGS